MSVYNRPLFRQMGGPAQPMPQDMAPPAQQLPPEAAMLQQVEQVSAAQGQELGKAYAEQMVQGIDAAQSTEELINAFRGNEMPLEARRDELADYVGQGDADQTPESVLAMVQPVIMMTEEGAMNSGIGNLMQQLTGDIDMITEGGQPTDMGQGVGSLMMAGAPEAPAPQNFRQGGEVAHLQNGSGLFATAPSTSFFETYSKLLGDYDYGSEVKKKYEGLRDVFSDIFSEEDRAAAAKEQKDMTEAQALFSIARGGLRFMAGDPKVGGSVASQAGAAFEPTAAEIAALGMQAQERKDKIRREDQQMRLARLQAGISAADRAQASQEAVAIAGAKALQPSSSSTILYAPRGKAIEFEGQTLPAEIAVPANDRSTQNQLIRLGYSTVKPKGEYSQEAIDERLDDPTTLMLLKQGLVMGVENPDTYRAMSDLASKLKENPVTGAKPVIGAHLDEYARLLQSRELRERTRNHFDNMFNAYLAQGVGTQADAAEQATANAEEEVAASGKLLEDIKDMSADNSQDMLLQQFNEFMNNPSLTEGNIPAYRSPLMDYVDSRVEKIAGLNMRAATGLASLPLSIIEYSVSQIANEFGLLLDSNAVSDSIAARRIFESVMADARRYFYGAPGEDRPLAQEFARDEENFPKMSAFESDTNASEKVDNLASRIRKDIQLYQKIIDDSTRYRGVDVSTARRRLTEAIAIERILDTIYNNYRFGRQSEIPDPEAKPGELDMFYGVNLDQD